MTKDAHCSFVNDGLVGLKGAVISALVKLNADTLHSDKRLHLDVVLYDLGGDKGKRLDGHGSD